MSLPMYAKVRFAKITLWLPLILFLWPIVLLLALIFSPLLALLSLAVWITTGTSPFRQISILGEIISATRGLEIEVHNHAADFYIAIC